MSGTSDRVFRLKYGRGSISAAIPDESILAVLEPESIPGPGIGPHGLEQALDQPIASPLLFELAGPGKKAALVVSDVTRPCPTHLLVPPVLARLRRAGMKDEDITIVIATGTHRPTTPAEKEKLLGAAVFGQARGTSHRGGQAQGTAPTGGVRCLDHSCSGAADLDYLGVSSYGTPIYLNGAVMEADIKIGIANIEPHVFAGYSGGYKSVMPGTAGLESIMKNHEMIYLYPRETRAGTLDNPIKKDIDEIGRRAGLDYLFNVVLDDAGRIVGAFAGRVPEAFGEGVKRCDGVYKRPLQQKGDIVIASAGGYPKDINFYQAQKALDYASRAVKGGGAIILVAECSEGIGSEPLARFMEQADSWEQVINLGRQEASYHPYGLRGLSPGVAVILVSSLVSPPGIKKALRCADSFEVALRMAMGCHERGAGIVLMPYAGSTLPVTA